MTDKPFDPTKPYRLRNGWLVRLLCTDAAGVFPLVGLARHPNGTDSVKTWTASGRCTIHGDSDDLDLVNIPTKHEGWVNVYSGSGGNFASSRVYTTEAEALIARRYRPDGCVATVKIEWEEP